MESTNFPPVSLQPVVATIGDDLGPLWARSPREPSTSNGRFLCGMFCALLGVHVALLARLQANDSLPHRVRKASQVEIQITRPSPAPKPVVVPLQEVHPPPPKLASPRPPLRITAPEPVHAAPAAVGEAPVAEVPRTEDPVAAPGAGGDVSAPVVQVAAPAPPPPPPAPVIEAKEGANYLKNPRPAYPRVAMREGWQGSVLLRVRVLPNGRPGEITVQTSSGRGVLDDAAAEAVKAWTFVPATQGGSPIAGWVNVPIVFHLQ